MLTHLVLSVAALAMQAPAQPSGMVYGQVRSSATGEPLRYAVVEVVSANARNPIRAQTDSDGFYYLHNIPTGWRVLRASHIDHAPHEAEVHVRTGSQLFLNIVLELRPVPLPVVTARVNNLPTGMSDTVGARPSELGTATVHVLEATPGVAELGLAEAAREVPGQDPPDPSDVLFVRGGGADLKLVLLNGAPVYAPFQIGGLIHALDAEMLRSATLYLGGAPARYDGGLSYVMDLETRSGRQRGAHATMSMDMLAARTVLEGPLGEHVSFLASGRAVHGLGATPFVGDPFPYTYGDAIARTDIDLGRDGNVSLTGYWNRERVLLDSVGAIDQAAQWGNAAGSVRYRTDVAGAEALFTVAAGEFTTQLPLGQLEPVLTEATSRRTRAAADLVHSLGRVRLQFGGSYDRIEIEHRAWPRDATRDSTLMFSQSRGDVAGVYVDADVMAGRRLRLRGGLRADVFSISPATRLAPRVSATVLLTNRSALTVAAGRYRQYVRSTSEAFPFYGAVPDKDEQPRLQVARASHLLVSLDQDLGDDMSLRLEGFYKSYEGLPSASGEEADASGLDLWVRRSRGRLTGWLGYSLAWVWATDRTPFSAQEIFAGRHLVSAGLSGPVPVAGAFDVRISYGAGLPYTAIPDPETTPPVFAVGAPAFTLSAAEPTPASPTEPNEPYLRLDAQIARTFLADWYGFAFEFTPYLKVINALDRRDALFYHLDRNSGSNEPQALAALPVLPIVGLEWKF